MICLGFDYGTTNSLLARVMDASSGDIWLMERKPSAIMMDGRFIQSPKRLLSVPGYDGNLVSKCVTGLTKEMLQNRSLSGDEPVRLTVTVPNAFKDAQCKLILDAVTQAGQAVFGEERLPSGAVSLLPEPVAAALYYVYLKAMDIPSQGILVVCDIGGGTTDLAVVQFRVERTEGNRVVTFHVICTDGDDQLGGDDIDRILAGHLKGTYSLSDGQYDDETLLAATRALKRKLSSAWFDEEVEVALSSPEKTVQAVIETGTFEHLGEPLVFRLNKSSFEKLICTDSRNPMETLLSRFARKANSLKERYALKASDPEAHLDPDLSRCIILPVGGSSRIPRLQEVMKEVFGGELFILPGEGDSPDRPTPFDSVVKGASIYSAWLSGSLNGFGDIRIKGRTLHRISLRATDGKLITIVDRNMPAGEEERLEIYEVKEKLHPERADDDQSFSLKEIELYQGDGKRVGDAKSGKPPVLMSHLTDRLAGLNDKIYLNGRALNEVPVEISLGINKDGRVACLNIRVEGGNKDGSLYELPIRLIE